jgi:peptidyl-prolyl cis-trans isomerase C
MRQKNRIAKRFIFLSLLGITVYVLPLSPQSLQAEEQRSSEAKKVVAKVNGKPIYEEQLKPEVEKRLNTFRKYGMRKEDPDLVRRLRSRALDKLIGEELISQESQRLTIEDIDEKVKQKLKALERKYDTRGGFEKYLKLRNLTMEDVRRSLRARVYVDAYLKKKGLLEPPISEDRIRDTYERYPGSYSREETIKVSHILIAVDGTADDEKKEQAKQKAEKIHKEILEGKDFAEMAKNHSECNSASGGGSLRYIKSGYMPEEFSRVAFAMEKDAVSEVVKTKFGYHIIKVFDKKSAGVTPFEEIRDFIKKGLQQEESKKKLAAHIAELKKKAKIEILQTES